MSGRMKWEAANQKVKRALSVADEREYRKADAAARWIEGRENFLKLNPEKRKRTPAPVRAE